MAQNQQTPPSGNEVAGSVLFKKFISSAEGYIRQPTRLKSLLTDAYKKASEKNDVGTLAHEAWETLQTMFRLIKASVSGEYKGVPTSTLAAAVAVLIYFISPIDLIPDFIPVLGLLDDVALVAWFSTTLKHEMDRFQEWELTRPAEVATAGAYVPSGREATAPAASAAATATATASNQTKHAADALDEQAAMSPAAKPSHSNDPAAATPQPAEESAKHAGTDSVAANAPASSREPGTTATDTDGNMR